MLQKTIAEKGGWIGKYFDSDLKPKWPENDGFVKGTEDEVVEPLEVKAGVVAEWFGKPGGGIQYALEKDMDFQKLLDRGIIRQVN